MTTENEKINNAFEIQYEIWKKNNPDWESAPKMKTPEDDEFERIKMESGWRKRQVATTLVIPDLFRNAVLEEVAKEFDKMSFGDTSQSFAIFVRNMKR
jgi:hypothetical protein